MAHEIVVVGAGIAGLATAVALQRRGHDVTVIEERTDTSSGAGISIWPNALAALDEIGVGDAVRESGGRSPPARCAGATARGCAAPRRNG
jgi:2-polyprenyl-6-methoxyphenol hydroxylase-like FAD-dependent oxidoreductase